MVLVGLVLWVVARVLPPAVRIMGRPIRQSKFLPLGAFTIFAQGKGQRGCSCSHFLRLKKKRGLVVPHAINVLMKTLLGSIVSCIEG